MKLARFAWKSDRSDPQFGPARVHDPRYKTYSSEKELQDHYPTGYEEWHDIVENPTLADYESALEIETENYHSSITIVKGRKELEGCDVARDSEFMKRSVEQYEAAKSIHQIQMEILRCKVASLKESH